jgi:hypothetical protein
MPLPGPLSHFRGRKGRGEGALLTGVIVGTVTIAACTRHNSHYEWHLTGVKRLEHPRKPKRMPQPVWFRPF